MKSLTIFHADLPPPLRYAPYARESAPGLTREIWRHAKRVGLSAPFALVKFDDRIMVREVKPGNEVML